MKKFRFFAMVMIVVAVCAGFTSCGDDDDDAVDSKAIVGTWVGTFNNDGGYYGDDEVVTMTFTANGKMTAKSESETAPEGDWTFSGSYKLTNYNFDEDDDYATGTKVFLISIVGHHSDYPDEDPYDDDIEPEPCYIQGDELIISFDGSDYRLKKQ